jgi:hypothetical protein
MAEFLHRNKLAHWARNEALPEVVRLFDQGRFTAAYDLAVEAAKYVPDDAILAGLWPDISRTVSIHTTPSGAKVYRKDYAAPDARWEPVGVSPLENVRVPRGLFRWKIDKKGLRWLKDLCFRRSTPMRSSIVSRR